MQYVRPRLEAVIAARITAADRRLVEAAAAARGATLSAWVADIATRAARKELLHPVEDRVPLSAAMPHSPLTAHDGQITK